MDRLSAAEFLAELLALLEYRCSGSPVWISAVYDHDGSLLIGEGGYHLVDDCFFVGTQLPARWALSLPQVKLRCTVVPRLDAC